MATRAVTGARGARAVPQALLALLNIAQPLIPHHLLRHHLLRRHLQPHLPARARVVDSATATSPPITIASTINVALQCRALNVTHALPVW